MTEAQHKIQTLYDSWHIYLRLLRSTAAYWVLFVIGIMGTVIGVTTDSLMVYCVKPIFENWSLGYTKWWFAWLPLLVTSILSLRGVGYFLSSCYLTRVGRQIVRDYRQQIFTHLMHLPASYYDRETSGKLLATLIYNTEQVATAATEALITVLQEGLMLVGLLVTMLVLSWQLTLIFLLTAPAISFVVRYTARRLRHLSGNVQGTMGQLTQAAAEGIENYRVVKIFGGEDYEIEKFNATTNQHCQRERKVVVTSALSSSLTQIITALPLAVIILIATGPLYNLLSIAGLSAFFVAILRLLTPLRRLTKINTEIQRGIAGAHSIFALLDEPIEDDLGNKNTDMVQGKIEYRGVSFIYPQAHKNILRDISFTISPGQKVALVGKSGGGKSTLVSLLPRFYDVTRGEILVDDINIKDYKLNTLRRQFALVSQHLTLFNDTLAHNIAYGALGSISEERVLQALDAAHLREFVEQLPEGLNTLVGENGLLLSGGQRQRVAIARALLKDAPILILDEATSALDTESERYIQDALASLMQGRTTLIIAHRLSTIEHVDKIIVLEHGRIVEAGTHTELLQMQGKYAKLHKLQFKGGEEH